MNDKLSNANVIKLALAASLSTFQMDLVISANRIYGEEKSYRRHKDV